MIEDQRKRAFGEASRRVDEQARVLDGLEREERGARVAFAGQRSGELSPTQLRLQESYLVALERRIRREGAELVKRLQVREERRVAFVEARKQVRVLERLRERRMREYRRDVEREEQKILDEVRRTEEAA
jgi:flagellar FliJ protein